MNSKVRIQTEQGEQPVEVDTPPATGPVAPPPIAVPPEPINEDAEPVRAKRGKTWVTYLGHADVLRVDGFALWPGVPVEVPKDLAEGLLTHPFEEFRVSDVAPLPPVEE